MDKKNKFSLVIDDVFYITGRGTLVVGEVREGHVRIGDNLKILTNDKVIPTQCFFLEKFLKTLNEATAGEYIGVYLRNVTKQDVQRGMTLVNND